MAEIIELADVLRARTRRRERMLTARCLAIMEACLVDSRLAYDAAPIAERPARAQKIRTLEELIAYTGARC